MTQLRINYGAVGKFNDTAPALESITIGRRKFDLINDYWHNNPKGGNCPSVIVREPAKRTPFGMSIYPVGSDYFRVSSNPFRNGSENFNAYQTWAIAVRDKHLP